MLGIASLRFLLTILLFFYHWNTHSLQREHKESSTNNENFRDLINKLRDHTDECAAQLRTLALEKSTMEQKLTDCKVNNRQVINERMEREQLAKHEKVSERVRLLDCSLIPYQPCQLSRLTHSVSSLN